MIGKVSNIVGILRLAKQVLTREIIFPYREVANFSRTKITKQGLS